MESKYFGTSLLAFKIKVNGKERDLYEIQSEEEINKLFIDDVNSVILVDVLVDFIVRYIKEIQNDVFRMFNIRGNVEVPV